MSRRQKKEQPFVRLYYTVPELAALAGRSRFEIRSWLIEVGLIPRNNARRKNIILLATIKQKCPLLWASLAEMGQEREFSDIADWD